MECSQPNSFFDIPPSIEKMHSNPNSFFDLPHSVTSQHVDYIIIGWTVNNEKVYNYIRDKYNSQIWDNAAKYEKEENLLFSVSSRNGEEHCFYGMVIRNGSKACNINSIYKSLSTKYHRQQSKKFGAYHKTIRIFSIADFRDDIEWT